MKGVAALRTAKRQPLTAGLIDTPAVVAGPRGISGIDLDHFETRALGFVAEYVEEPRVSPRTVVIAGLPATRPGALIPFNRSTAIAPHPHPRASRTSSLAVQCCMSSTSRASRPATRLKVRVLERVPLDLSLPLILLQCSFLGLRCPAGKKCASSPVVATAR